MQTLPRAGTARRGAPTQLRFAATHSDDQPRPFLNPFLRFFCEGTP